MKSPSSTTPLYRESASRLNISLGTLKFLEFRKKRSQRKLGVPSPTSFQINALAKNHLCIGLIFELQDCLHINKDLSPRRSLKLKTKKKSFRAKLKRVKEWIMVLATQIPRWSFMTETVWPDRMKHVPELCLMGADITVKNNRATINGGRPLRGAPVMATDLRAAASLVLAALCATGTTTISGVAHLDRGYHALKKNLEACGASIVLQNPASRGLKDCPPSGRQPYRSKL